MYSAFSLTPAIRTGENIDGFPAPLQDKRKALTATSSQALRR
jgi:hypothetical protein